MDSNNSLKRALDSSPEMDSKKLKSSSEMDAHQSESDASFDAVFPTYEQFLESCMAQAFSLPKPIMEYMWLHPSTPEVYEKLIKTCKLFFIKNPILVLRNFNYYSKYGWKCRCDKPVCEHMYQRIEKLDGQKLWITGNFFITSQQQQSNFLSTFIPKIWQCNIKTMKLSNQLLLFDDLKFLAAAGSIKDCTLFSNVITYDDGEEVPMEEIIKVFAGCEKFVMDFDRKSNNAACKNYAEFIAVCQNVGEIRLAQIPDDFNIQMFYDCLKESESRAMITIVTSVHTRRLHDVFNQILSTEDFQFIPPVITYLEQPQLVLHRRKMRQIQATAAAKLR